MLKISAINKNVCSVLWLYNNSWRFDMKNKYYDAICALSEILLEQNNELNWKETQLDMKDNEIEKLKQKLVDIEKYIDFYKEEGTIKL